MIGPSPKTLRPLVWIIVVGTLARAAAATQLPLHFDEAYYWLWAHQPDWGYHDQPPMIAYLILLTTRLGDAEIWVRLSALLIGAATTYVLFLLGRDLFDDRVGLFAAALFQVVPLLMLGGMPAVPDAPLYLAWMVALRCCWLALHGRPKLWIAAGLAMGLGLLSKFFIVWLGVGIALYTVLYARSDLRRKEPYLSALIALSCILPLIIWNLHHGWPSVRFVLYERYRIPAGLASFESLWVPLSYNVIFLTPAFMWGLWAMLRHAREERFRYLLWTSLPALAFTILVTPLGMVRGSWLGPTFLELAIVLAALWNRPVAIMALCNAVVVALVIALVVLHGFPSSLLFSSESGWDDVARRVEYELAQVDKGRIVVTDNYDIATELSYYGRLKFPVLLAGATTVWPQFDGFRGANGVGVTYSSSSAYPWARCFRRDEEDAAENVTVRDHLIRQVRVFRLYNLSASCPAEAGGETNLRLGGIRRASLTSQISGHRPEAASGVTSWVAPCNERGEGIRVGYPPCQK